MLVTAWILLVVFGLSALAFTRKLLFGRLNWLEVLVWVTSTVIVAISAGVIWGGLKIGW